MNKPTHIIIIAGEPSADTYGALLSDELKRLQPEIIISGIGSNKMRKAGVEIFADLSQYAVIGFIEALKHIHIFKKIFALCLKKIDLLKPQAIILIDFPGFNLRLAKKIKQIFPAVKIIYYVSPQVWAWGKHRLKLIQKVVDKMIVLFKFEAEFYKKNNIPAEFAGHPLTKIVKRAEDKKKLYTNMEITKKDNIIALLPGSRRGEIKRIFPLMLKSAVLIAKQMPETKFILLKSTNITEQTVQKIIKPYLFLKIKIIDRNIYDYLSVCTYAWVCSGTATLETAILEIPMLIVYKTSCVTWFLSKMLIKLPFIGIVNIVAGEKIFPEFIQFQATPKNIANCSINFLNTSYMRQNKFKQKLKCLRQELGTQDAAKKAALIIHKIITKTAKK
ncbi:MAG: lipid-A-disaccharide synthase [Candidatus Omnitrophota bacterium]|nr:MAG: lipid-A-disaccharide synthase [Candidatus Omnitrophota bacterium]